MKKVLLFVVSLLVSCSSMSAQKVNGYPTMLWSKFLSNSGGDYVGVIKQGTQVVVSSSSRVWIFNAQTGDEIYTQDIGSIMANAEINGKDYLFISTGDTLIQWDVERKERVAIYTDSLLRNSQGYKVGKFVQSVSVLPSTNRIAVGFGSLPGPGDKPTVIVHVYAIGSNTILRSINNAASDLLIVRYSPDGKLLAVASYGSGVNGYAITLHNTETWDYVAKDILILGGKEQYLSSMEFSPDSKLLATTTTRDGKVKIWNIPARKPDTVIENNHPRANSVLFFNNQPTLIIGFSDLFGSDVSGVLSFYNIHDKKFISELKGDYGVGTLSKDKDDKILAYLGAGRVTVRRLDSLTSSAENSIFTTLDGVLYPNPTTGTIAIERERNYTQSSRVEITNLQGETLLQGLASEHLIEPTVCELDITRFVRGVYVLRIIDNKEVKTFKIVKE